MSVKIYKNFISKQECAELNQITLELINKGLLHKGLDRGKWEYPYRLTNRQKMGKTQYPALVYEISKKIKNFLNIDAFPIIEGHGNNGIVVSYTMKHGDVYAHKDPRSSDGLPTYRCNILTQANESGCDLYVGGEKIDIEIGDLHCYLASEIEHYVTEARGEIPRIMWMFGSHIPKSHWQEYGIKR